MKTKTEEVVNQQGTAVAKATRPSGNSATWIWYPGDYAIWLANRMQNRRTERGAFLPVFWKMDSHYVLVEFHKDYNLKSPEKVQIAVEGLYNVRIDGKSLNGNLKEIIFPAGHHRLSLKVYNQAVVPAIYVKGLHIQSDSSWLVTVEDKEWIDASGKASDKSGTTYVNAGSWNFVQASELPSAFRLPTKAEHAVKVIQLPNGNQLFDFGKESFGFVKLKGIHVIGGRSGQGEGDPKVLRLYYGESKEEALSVDSCETLDTIMLLEKAKTVNADYSLDTQTTFTKAFRYVQLAVPKGVVVDSVKLLFEYAPVQQRGSFKCSDSLINKIWDVSAYTLHLNTREFFIDGIKRDRWIWSGDAYQSYLMNYYLYFDAPTVKRTVYALRGKDPVTSHVNTIMDYSFYWFMGIYDYYQYTGDTAFVRNLYPRMQALMDYCLSRRDKQGYMEGLAGDWVFIDWADNLTKTGELSFEQLLLCRSLEAMAICARINQDTAEAANYANMAVRLKKQIFTDFWDKGKQAFIHRILDGKKDSHVFRYTNMFALLLGYLNESQSKSVIDNVLLNDQVQAIHTPYMRFYELEALCVAGKQKDVIREIKSYWGGMLENGATSFWEAYDPAQKGAARYAMYGRPFGKSLCHAWGASPLYLLGKYYLGVKPVTPGYGRYQVSPDLGGLKWIEGDVPAADGNIHVYCSDNQLKIRATIGLGTLKFKSKRKPQCAGGNIQQTAPQHYSLEIRPNQQYVVDYQSL